MCILLNLYVVLILIDLYKLYKFYITKQCKKQSECHCRETVDAQRITANFSRMATGTKKMQL